MAQYKDGLINVVNGSDVVTGVGTLWLGNIAVNNLLTINGVAYTIDSNTTNTNLTLTGNYNGPTLSNQVYGISLDETAGGLPLLSAGDLNTAAIYNEAMKNIDNYNLINLRTAAYLDAGVESGNVTIQTKGLYTPNLVASFTTTITAGAGATFEGTWRLIGDQLFLDFYINFDNAASIPVVGSRFIIDGVPVAIRPLNPSGIFSAGSATLSSSVTSSSFGTYDVKAENSNGRLHVTCMQINGSVNYGDTIGGRISYKINY